MAAAHRRHDMTDAVWERLRPHLAEGKGQRGRPAYDNRRFIDASYIKAHPHSAGATGGNQGIARTKGG